MSEQELNALKEQIKKELMQEMSKPKKETVWKKVKKEYEEEFKKFNYIDHFETTSCDGRLISRDKQVLAEYPMMNAIGTLLRIKYKVDNVSKINADYNEMREIVGKILGILKAKE